MGAVCAFSEAAALAEAKLVASSLTAAVVHCCAHLFTNPAVSICLSFSSFISSATLENPMVHIVIQESK